MPENKLVKEMVIRFLLELQSCLRIYEAEGLEKEAKELRDLMIRIEAAAYNISTKDE